MVTGGRSDPVDACRGATEADHRDEEGHARSSRGSHAGLPKHRHQGKLALMLLLSL